MGISLRGRTAVAAALTCIGLGVGAAVGVQMAVGAGTNSTVPPSAKAPTPVARPAAHPALGNGQLAPNVVATNVHCGQTITASITLNGDLNCAQSAFAVKVTGNSVNLNLGGHTISGGYTGTYGVWVTGTSDTVQNGVVTGFGYGVRIEGAKATVTTIRSNYNTITGIGDYGSATKLTTVVVANNSGDGVYALASGAIYTAVHALNNDGTGIVLAGGGTSGVTLTSNITNGNAGYGIYDFDFGTKLTKNVANVNAYNGIQVDDVTAIDGGGNLAHGNDYASGLAPVECTGVVCS
jgi:hypothetical protein